MPAHKLAAVLEIIQQEVSGERFADPIGFSLMADKETIFLHGNCVDDVTVESRLDKALDIPPREVTR